MFFAELHYGLPAELGFADLKTVCMTTRNAMMDPTNKSQDLNGNYSLNVSFPCWEDSQPLQWKKMVVLSSISILTLASNSVILVAILSMKQKVFYQNQIIGILCCRSVHVLPKITKLKFDLDLKACLHEAKG